MEVRYLTPADDRGAVSKVYEESWKCAYKGIIPQDYLDSIPEGRWAPFLDRPEEKHLLCTEGGRIIGTSSFGDSRLPRLPGWGEIISFYLLPQHMGRGAGKC